MTGETLARTRPDTSTVVICPQCRARFIGIGERSAEDNLQAQVVDKYAPHPRKVTEDVARAIELMCTTITDRIGNGTYRPGQSLSINKLTAELGVSRHHADTAVSQLVSKGCLGRTAVTSAYSRVAVSRAAVEAE